MEQWQVTWEKYENTIWMCRWMHGLESKIYLEWICNRILKATGKTSLNPEVVKRRLGKMLVLMNEAWSPVTQDTGKGWSTGHCCCLGLYKQDWTWEIPDQGWSLSHRKCTLGERGSENTRAIWAYIYPWVLMEYTHKYWVSWLVLSWSHLW